MAKFFLLLTILLVIPNHRLFSAAAQPPSSSPILSPPISAVSSFPTPSPSPVTIPPPPPPSSPQTIITITPPPPPLSPPPTTTINSPTPPPQQIQLHNIIYAPIGACDFAGWANILSDVSVHEIGTILHNTVYGSPTAQHPPSEVVNNRRSGSATIFTDYYLVFSIFCAVFAFNIEIERFSKTKIALFLCGLCFAATAHGFSLDGSCVVDYFKGGAPAIFQSPKCTNWILKVNSYKSHSGRCDLATRQGHRPYQEDHMSCNLIKMPVHGRDGDKEAKVYVLAIFEGHGGAEASEMANQKLLDYFLLHVIFCGSKEAVIAVDNYELNPTSPPNPRVVFLVDTVVDEFSHNNLKEALVHTIHDIDMEFSSEAYKNHYKGGSTATVVLLLNDKEILVASLGNSPAHLCTGSPRKLRAEKLSRNHCPDEEDERARIEAAGGFVQVVDVPRVNGRLAVSRAIGDISFKRFGVIAEPEVKGWRKLTRKDRYLFIASGGILKEGLTPDGVCKIIEVAGKYTSSVSDWVVGGLKKRSLDNLSAIVLPLGQPTCSNFSSQPSKDEL